MSARYFPCRDLRNGELRQCRDTAFGIGYVLRGSLAGALLDALRADLEREDIARQARRATGSIVLSLDPLADADPDAAHEALQAVVAHAGRAAEDPGYWPRAREWWHAVAADLAAVAADRAAERRGFDPAALYGEGRVIELDLPKPRR